MTQRKSGITTRPWTQSTLKRARRSGLQLFGMALVFALCALATVAGVRYFQQSNAFVVKVVNVEGVEEERALEILAYANIREGTPLFSVDRADMAQLIEGHPYVERASVEVEMPGTVKVIVEERRAFALVSANDLYVVDENGIPFTSYDDAHVNLPLLTGDVVDVEEPEHLDTDAILLGLLALHAMRSTDERRVRGESALPLLQETLEEVHLVRGFGVEMVFKGGLRVRLGEHGLSAKLAKMQEILRYLHKRGLDPVELHLDDARRPERVAVRLRPKSEMTEDSGT
ncbi:MAG: FtsQ-type POTRA domain-containing protein [Deltaproteobacteria bacterium]|nr:FtsQ-type POTRA domain-containing protein [Deltaproteobacteria bacterium]